MQPSGRASGSRRFCKMQSWGPGIQSFKASNMNFGYFVQYTSLMKKHCWFFLIPPTGSASGLSRCCKMQSWGPGIHIFKALNMKFGYLVQHTSPMKTHYRYFLIALSGSAQGSRRCCKTQSWGPGIHSFKALNMKFGYFVQHRASTKGRN